MKTVFWILLHLVGSYCHSIIYSSYLDIYTSIKYIILISLPKYWYLDYKRKYLV